MASRNMETYLRIRQQADFRDLTGHQTEVATLAAFAPDVEIHEPGCLPQGGVHKGPEAYLQLHRTMRALWEQRSEVLHVWDAPEDNVVVIYQMMDWTAKATGRSIRFPVVNVMTFRDGLIAKVEVFH